MSSNEDIEKIIEDLILSGGLEVSGLDADTGEPLYQFTEKITEIDSPLADAMQELFHMHVMALWEKGFLDMNPTERNPMVRLTELSLDDNAINSLHPDLKRTLVMIIARFEDQ